MSKLHRKVREEEEVEFSLRSKDFFRPRLKQMGNSLYEIQVHYMSKDDVNIIPSDCKPNLTETRDKLLRHLEGDSFLYKNNIVTGSTLDQNDNNGQCLPSLVILMDSLALAMDMDISPRPSEVQCDILLAICGQPVIVLTLVDGDKNSKSVTVYNASVARGITSSLRTFMEESVNTVYGVLSTRDMETREAFKQALAIIAEDSAFFVTESSLTTSPSKYEKIVTAIWAGIAQTKSVISRGGSMDTDYLKFLTKDQCIILLENINKKNVDVEFHTGSGATTLMVEVARRLSKLNDTLVVCGSQEEMETLRSVYPSVKAVDELTKSDFSRYTNIIDETGTVSDQVIGNMWRFSRVYSELEQLQQKVEMLELVVTNTRKMIYLFSSEDRQDKMLHLSREMETLKLLDISFQWLITSCHLPSMALQYLPVKHLSAGDTNGDGTLENEEQVRYVLDQFKYGIQGRQDMFPLLGYMGKQIRGRIPYMEAKTDYLELVTSGMSSDGRSVNHIHRPLFQGQPVMEIVGNDQDTGYQQKTHSTKQYITEEASDLGKMMEVKARQETLEKEMHSLEGEIRQLPEAKAYCVEWGETMQYLAREFPTIRMQDIITNVIGEDEIQELYPDHATPKQQSVLDAADKKRGISRSHIHQLRHLQLGTLGRKDIWDILTRVITDDQRRLSSLRTQSDHLERVYGRSVYIIGEVDTDRSFFVECPAMILNRERVHSELAVLGDTELVNTEASGGHHHTDQFKYYCGTCSLPIPLSPSTTRYWETHTRLQVKEDVWRYGALLEMGLTQEGQLDTDCWVSYQTRSSWAVCVEDCVLHPGLICTRVWKEGSQVGECQTDTMSRTRGTDVTLRYGVVVDVARGRLSFIDLDREKVLHKFDIEFTQTLFPMFSVGPDPDDFATKMTLVSGSDIAMTDKKKSLIFTALS